MIARNELGVRKERSWWRDEALSNRHRVWGFDCPAVDVDWLVLEYNRGFPSALIEFKRVPGAAFSFDNANMQALSELATRAEIPAIIVFYTDNPFWQFRLYPLNEIAKKWVSYNTAMSELQFVELLHNIRGEQLSAKVSFGLSKQKPTKEFGGIAAE